MLERLVVLLVRTYLGKGRKTWAITLAAMGVVRLLRRTISRKELIDTSSIKPGEMIIIENLDISHKNQIKDLKRSKREQKKAKHGARRDR